MLQKNCKKEDTTEATTILHRHKQNAEPCLVRYGHWLSWHPENRDLNGTLDSRLSGQIELQHLAKMVMFITQSMLQKHFHLEN